MTSINDLLGKGKNKNENTKTIGTGIAGKNSNSILNTISNNNSNSVHDSKLVKEEPKKPMGFSLNLGSKKQTHKPDELIISPLPDGNGVLKSVVTENPDPFASLGNVLDEISFDLSDISESAFNEQHQQTPNPNEQFKNPTLTDVEKFVFEEQPEHSTQEITDLFSSMLDDLSLATGEQVPTNVARCLKFIKEHAFLADILKPEAVGVLTNGLRRSYGFIVKAKTEKGEKRKAKEQKVSAVLDDLANLSF